MRYTPNLTRRELRISKADKDNFAEFSAKIIDSFDNIDEMTEEEAVLYDRTVFGYMLDYIIKNHVRVPNATFSAGSDYVRSLMKTHGLDFDSLGSPDKRVSVVCHYVMPTEYEKALFVEWFLKANDLSVSSE